MGVSMTSSPYSAPAPSVYDDNLSSGSGAVPSPRGSPFPSGDYSPIPDYGQQYVPLPTNCESWANTVPCPVPSNVSSPSSSADDYSAGYIPTSVPTSLMPSNNTSSSSLGAVGHSHKDVIKMEYEDVESHGTIPQQRLSYAMLYKQKTNHTQCLDAGYRLSNPSMQPVSPHTYMAQQQQSAWNMYPVYYPQAQSSVH
ncbi:hypothetical protein FGSG_12169 [Fusarium graminearum PH-1]|uniref:hypothetical protein n=1 Tax=Gibberella zeae (strain ATCC MYA-4620 / CBS 123657 / FGSC 9075 / NRRL 31084 / PH-1) TaxID=229533 RepID=UPI00021F135B|nr:hypothetical protein FGSG_12169 [Fusarium graminearum PH-1]ESU08092.1 hypothetical protein FGSG_12169 [Fusarium graminearum PH-1]|eukprot:XP_011318577.1 hypothetical protein FGSG_12169 [Fusarium graminearum PH-1]